jgi:hypothetical protein
MSKIERISPLRMIIRMLCFVFCLTIISSTIYYYSNPKVYVISPQKGKIGNDIYDCIIPKECLFDETVMYFTKEKETVLGTRFVVFSKCVTILAEENGKVAVPVDIRNDDIHIVVAYEGELIEGGDVIVFRS